MTANSPDARVSGSSSCLAPWKRHRGGRRGSYGSVNWVASSGPPYLNKSSKAFFALLVADEDEDDGPVAGVPVWRSTVVRAANSAQLLRSSFGATRAGMRSWSVHSQRTLVSNDTHWMQACTSTPQREQRSSRPTGSDSRFPQRVHRNTSRAAMRLGVFGPRSSCN